MHWSDLRKTHSSAHLPICLWACLTTSSIVVWMGVGMRRCFPLSPPRPLFLTLFLWSFFAPNIPPMYSLYTQTHISGLSPTPYMYRTPIQRWIRTRHENFGKNVDNHHCAARERERRSKRKYISLIQRNCTSQINSSAYVENPKGRKPTIKRANAPAWFINSTENNFPHANRSFCQVR